MHFSVTVKFVEDKNQNIHLSGFNYPYPQCKAKMYTVKLASITGLKLNTRNGHHWQFLQTTFTSLNLLI